jgi:signal transduction histidine kinase/ligand-binding sensor domain-containing protein/DNA-binding response OmpR family regulator
MQLKKYPTILVLTLYACFLQAQTGKFFSADKQLSSSFVTQVYLDKEGFIWATTRDGINRYDGYQFRVFSRTNETDKTLASNYVNTMLQDRNGLFYFGMYGALQTWDGRQFYNVTMTDLKGQKGHCYANCFLQRKNGDVLAGTSGLGVMKFSDKTHAQQIGGALANIHTINAMMEDQKNRLWIVTDAEGVICYDGKTTKHYLNGRNDLVMTGLCEDRLGHIYLGTSNAGLFRLIDDEFVHVSQTGNNAISALYCDHFGNIVLGYDGKGVAAYNPKDDYLLDNPFFSLEVDLSKSKVYSITEDNSGNLWLGLLQKGLFMQPITSSGFNYMGYKMGSRNMIGQACVISTLIDSKGRTWIGTDKDGLYLFDSNNQPLKHFSDHFPSTIMAIEEDPTGRIWIGSYREGYGYIDPVSMQYHAQPYADDDHLIVMDIESDNQQRLWMATMKHGVLCRSLKDGSVKRYVMDPKAETDRQVNSITNNYISQLSVSPDEKRLYVATSMGLCCLDIRTDNWVKTFGTNCHNYSVPVRVAREYSGHLWIGTNDGLFCLDLKGKVLKHYTTNEGLADNGVSAIEEDKNGKLWIGTNHGLSCLDQHTGLFQNYYADDGLQSNEFSDGASFTSDKGTILFGGTGGVTWFRPQDIVQRKWEATVQLTSFAINGQPINRGSHSGSYLITDTTVFASNHFELSYSDNTFSIEFSTLTYENPEHISYLYSVNGEPFIRMRKGVNLLTFSHLPSGTYRFRVKAERNNWETPERSFTVVVHSAWYRSSWAYFFYALVAGLFLWQLLAFRRHREQSRLRLQAHIHAEEMGEAKLRFFMNMSHEIRTPMTLIVTPLLTLLKDDDDPRRRSVYLTIKRNAERILSLINQMMDLRKIDKGQMQMRMRDTDLVAFIQDIYTLFESQAKTKGVSLSFNHDSERLPIWIDRANFDKVVMNILSNAFKYTPAGGHIDIRLTHDDQQAVIAVSDDGEQIPADKLDKIFERFYQTASTANDRHAGTGIGLDLTRSLVELHHGTITAHNLEKGCEFVITLPLGNAHLKADEIMPDAETAPTPAPVMEAELVDDEDDTPVILNQPANHRLTLVIAEDDDEIRAYLESELDTDYEVHACANGREALAEIHRSTPDLIISDVMMPEMDGNALCAKVKSNASTNHIPFIMLTAKSRDEDKLEGLETGADLYIVKPFNMDILRRNIINLINSHRLLRLKYGRNDDLEEKVDEILVKTPDEKLLERIMGCINKNIANSDLSVDMIAEEAGISRVHLHRKMKELTGQTPHDFIRNIRLKKAANLLANQGMNVTEVMYACGFANSASFSTVFKKFYGMSPRDYMKEHEER